MVTIDRQELFSAFGAQLSEPELEKALFDMGMELESFAEIVEIEITPDRMDLLSAQGLARALRYYLGKQKEFMTYPINQNKDYRVQVDSAMKDLRPYTVCAVVKGLKLTQKKLDGIIDLQEKLHATLGRQRKRAAMGLYPLETLHWPIHFSAQSPDTITFQPLDHDVVLTARQLLTQHPTGKKYAHLLDNKDMFPVFTDASGNVLSVPPIINSQTAGKVTTSTTDVFIECSGFDYATLEQMLTIITTSLADMGGALYAVDVHYADATLTTPRLQNQHTRFNPNRVQRTTGISLSFDQIEHYLHRMMHEVDKKNSDEWIIKTPAIRSDIWHAVDLVDDIARAHGFNNIDLQIPVVPGIGTAHPLEKISEDLAQVLVGLGHIETYTFSLTSQNEQLENMLIPEHKLSTVKITNGNENQAMLRISLLPQQLQLLYHNRNRPLPIKLFEIADVVLSDSTTDVKARNEKHCVALITDKTVTYTTIRQTVEALLRTVGCTVDFKAGSHPSFIPGRVATIVYNGVGIGVIGEMHPQVLDNFDLQAPVAAFEINLEAIKYK